MADCRFEEYDIIHNNAYTFYKLHENGKCQFDEFCSEIEREKECLGDLKSIIALMEQFSPQIQLPHKKFRHIEDKNFHDIFEFKKNKLRVYVVKQKPNIYIILGGYKKNQKKDIVKLKDKIKAIF